MNYLGELVSDVIGLIFPKTCEACGTELLGNEEIICITCKHALPKTFFYKHKDNAASQKFDGRVCVENVVSMYYFNKETRMQELLHALKYKNKLQVGLELGRLFAIEIKSCHWLSTVDCIIPIPLSNKKLKLRGYNQSELIAKGIAMELELPLNTDSVIRRKHTKSQTTMTIAERVENVRGAFEVINASSLSGKHILLVDDVLTTGATLESCAQEILKIQNTKISILTLAYAIE